MGWCGAGGVWGGGDCGDATFGSVSSGSRDYGKKKRVKYRRRERERESEREREEKKLTERLQHTYQITHQNGGLRLHGRRPSPSSRRENGVKPANSGDADKDADKDANADAGGVVLLHVRARACGVGPYKETTC